MEAQKHEVLKVKLEKEYIEKEYFAFTIRRWK